MQRRKRLTSRATAGIMAMVMVAVPVGADFFLEQQIDLGAYFGPLGNNPITLAGDGTYAYVGGYSSSADPADIGILRVNLADPNDAVTLAGGTQTVSQFRYYGGMFTRDGVLYALCDRPENTTASTKHAPLPI